MTEGKWHTYKGKNTEGDDGLNYRRYIHGPRSYISIEVTALAKRYNFGWGFEIGRNGSESDLGFHLYLGSLLSLWIRIRFPWTKIFRVRKSQDSWYEPRHYGFRIRPFDGCIWRIQLGEYNGCGPKSWREWTFTTWKILGRQRLETYTKDLGEYVVEIVPDGLYDATLSEVISVRYHVTRRGRLYDRIRKPESHSYINIRVDDGIPCEGKGENSWDCGMDGVFGTSGQTIYEAVANLKKAVERNRRKYGGPHNLPRPMTIKEAEEYVYSEGR